MVKHRSLLIYFDFLYNILENDFDSNLDCRYEKMEHLMTTRSQPKPKNKSWAVVVAQLVERSRPRFESSHKQK